jgi:type II secretory pathway pseudopilin PulG
MINRSELKMKAFGLAEIIVALGIFGTAMIATVAVAVSSLRTVKDNELSDLANSVVIRSIEYMKSPAVVDVLTNLEAGSSDHVFEITNPISSSPDDQKLEVVEKTGEYGTDNITTCGDTGVSARYRISITDQPNFVICNQIKVTDFGKSRFEIRSIVVYQTSKGLQTTELIGYRNTTGGG